LPFCVVSTSKEGLTGTWLVELGFTEGGRTGAAGFLVGRCVDGGCGCG